MPAVPQRSAAYGQYSYTYRPRPRRRRRLTQSFRLLLALLGAGLFLSGFLLGRSTAGVQRTPDAAPGKTQMIQQGQPPTEPSADPTGSEDWKLLLVNGDNPLPDDFQVPELTQLQNGHAVDSRAYPALQQMMDDARAAGLSPLICSSYRTQEKQQALFDRQVQKYLAQGCTQEEARQRAARWVAPPGTSEHQSGLAVDIVDISNQNLNEQQENTPVQQWLMAHCADYGFILRYPTDKSSLTGIGYEPWHYRYVGTEAAQEIMGQGLCLEEYLAR